ncbi:hypothetical protein GYA49_00355 [Candidatus Beckwithbacteria bacterium]|nr:hypothetical protein [Candidatus Beckwithbacteria bacterium]
MKKIVIVILVIAVLIITIAFLRFALGGNEDTWLCQNGQWVKHGNPSSLMPSQPCEP